MSPIGHHFHLDETALQRQTQTLTCGILAQLHCIMDEDIHLNVKLTYRAVLHSPKFLVGHSKM